MPKPKFSRNAAIAALLLGVIFAVTNVYLGAIHYRTLANISFTIAVLCDVAFAIFMILYIYGKAWVTEPARGPGQTSAIAPQIKPQLPQPPAPPAV